MLRRSDEGMYGLDRKDTMPKMYLRSGYHSYVYTGTEEDLDIFYDWASKSMDIKIIGITTL